LVSFPAGFLFGLRVSGRPILREIVVIPVKNPSSALASSGQFVYYDNRSSPANLLSFEAKIAGGFGLEPSF